MTKEWGFFQLFSRSAHQNCLFFGTKVNLDNPYTFIHSFIVLSHIFYKKHCDVTVRATSHLLSYSDLLVDCHYVELVIRADFLIHPFQCYLIGINFQGNKFSRELIFANCDFGHFAGINFR